MHLRSLTALFGAVARVRAKTRGAIAIVRAGGSGVLPVVEGSLRGQGSIRSRASEALGKQVSQDVLCLDRRGEQLEGLCLAAAGEDRKCSSLSVSQAANCALWWERRAEEVLAHTIADLGWHLVRIYSVVAVPVAAEVEAGLA